MVGLRCKPAMASAAIRHVSNERSRTALPYGVWRSHPKHEAVIINSQSAESNRFFKLESVPGSTVSRNNGLIWSLLSCFTSLLCNFESLMWIGDATSFKLTCVVCLFVHLLLDNNIRKMVVCFVVEQQEAWLTIQFFGLYLILFIVQYFMQQ